MFVVFGLAAEAAVLLINYFCDLSC